MVIEWISFTAGIIVGFVACILLWFWIEAKNAEKDNEECH